MAYTIAQQNKNFFSKIKPLLIYVALFLILGGFAYGVTVGMQKIPRMNEKSAITVRLNNRKADVYVNKEKLGETPLEKREVSAGTHSVEIKDPENPKTNYSTKLEFNPNVETTLIRDLGVSTLFSSGKNFWMKSGKTGLTVISQPSEARVFLDGNEIGETPFSLDNITSGNYTISVNKSGYEGLTARINIKEGHTLTVENKLFPIPLPANIERFEGSRGLYDLTIANQTIGNSPDRAKAINYWVDTRGIDGMDANTEENLSFDYYIDPKGNVYDEEGNLILNPEGLQELKGSQTGGYLGIGAPETGLTEEAREAYLELNEGVQMGTVLPTGVGWLRVRATPSLSGNEIAKINVGETFPVIETSQNWVKIKLDENQEGWVSKTYIELIQ